MGTARKSNNNKRLQEFGRHLESLILKKGYSSPYDFWIRQAGDDISRASLNYILAGKREPKLFTLILLMELLDVTPQELFNFGERKKSAHR
ncbi:MAG: helix-turn-helix domain-containing protein [Pseudobdellovibrionaceae bacterium]